MQKTLPSLCLTAIGLLAIGILTFNGRGEAGSNGQQPRLERPKFVTADQGDAGLFNLPSEAASEREERPELQLAQAKSSNAAPAKEDAGWIGIMFDESGSKKVVVKEVFPGGPAAFGRVRKGDVLLKVGDVAPKSVDEATAAIEKLTPGKPAMFAVQRGKKELQLKLPVESRAEFQQHYLREMMRRDPRDPKFAEHHGVSQADMSAELVRRLFEQNQRLETRMNQLITEVQSLRDELQKK